MGEHYDSPPCVQCSLFNLLSFSCPLLPSRAILSVLSFPDRQREGGGYVEHLLSLLVSVMGGIICHYIVKWLDRDDNDN